MAVPMTSKTFKMIASDALDAIFRDTYGMQSFENEYMVEVNFDGQDEFERINARTNAKSNGKN